MNEDIIIT